MTEQPGSKPDNRIENKNGAGNQMDEISLGKIAQVKDQQKYGSAGKELHSTLATLYTLYLPLNHNNGSTMELERLGWAQQEIMRYAGGLTKFAPSAGFWIDRTAKVYQDLVMPIQTVAPVGLEAEAWFAQKAAEMAVILEQEQIFVFTQPVWLIESAPLFVDALQPQLHEAS